MAPGGLGHGGAGTLGNGALGVGRDHVAPKDTTMAVPFQSRAEAVAEPPVPARPLRARSVAAAACSRTMPGRGSGRGSGCGWRSRRRPLARRFAGGGSRRRPVGAQDRAEAAVPLPAAGNQPARCAGGAAVLGTKAAPTLFLVPQVKLPKRLDLAWGARRANDAVPGLIVANWVSDAWRREGIPLWVGLGPSIGGPFY